MRSASACSAPFWPPTLVKRWSLVRPMAPSTPRVKRLVNPASGAVLVKRTMPAKSFEYWSMTWKIGWKRSLLVHETPASRRADPQVTASTSAMR